MTAYVRFANALAWHAEGLAHEFTQLGHEVMLMCLRDSLLARRLHSAPFRVNDSLRPTTIAPWELTTSIRGFKQTLREFRPDILHPHCSPGHTFLALSRSRRSPLPIVRTIAEPNHPKGHWLNRRLYRLSTDAMVFTSRSSKLRYEARGIPLPPEQAVLLPGFSAEEFVRDCPERALRQELGIPNDKLLLGIIARMSPEKGQEVLLRALAALTFEERNRLFVVMAGENSRERGQAELSHMAKELGVSQCVRFLEKLSDVRPLMRSLDAGLITSTRSEAICRVALEYMSFGLPVVTSDTNILSEVTLDGDTGWVFPNQDHNALAGILRAIVADRAELFRRGANGLRRVRTVLTRRGEAQEYLRMFERAIAGRALC